MESLEITRRMHYVNLKKKSKKNESTFKNKLYKEKKSKIILLRTK